MFVPVLNRSLPADKQGPKNAPVKEHPPSVQNANWSPGTFESHNATPKGGSQPPTQPWPALWPHQPNL